MVLGSRRARSLAVLLTALGCGALGAGCGGSVADADQPLPTTRVVAAPTPFCLAARNNSAALAPIGALAQGGSLPAPRLAAAVDAARRSGADLVAAAPGEIRADVQRAVDAVDVQLDALLRSGGDAASAAHDPAVSAVVDAPATVAANRKVASYVARTCRP